MHLLMLFRFVICTARVCLFFSCEPWRNFFLTTMCCAVFNSHDISQSNTALKVLRIVDSARDDFCCPQVEWCWEVYDHYDYPNEHMSVWRKPNEWEDETQRPLHNLGPRSAKSLADMLQLNCTLTELSIPGNQIGKRVEGFVSGTECFARALEVS